MVDLTNMGLPKVDQLTADDLIGGPVTITVKRFREGNDQQELIIDFEGDNGKPYKPCKSMIKMIKHVWGVKAFNFAGRKLTLYRDSEVKFGGLEVGGIRISHMSNITSEVTHALTASKANKKPFTVQPLIAAAPVDPALIEAGKIAASGGIEYFTAWGKNLTPEQKESLKPYLATWTKEAKTVPVAAHDEVGI